jgi:hypothetical protein
MFWASVNHIFKQRASVQALNTVKTGKTQVEKDIN